MSVIRQTLCNTLQLKQIFLSEDREEASKRFNEFKKHLAGEISQEGIQFRKEV